MGKNIKKREDDKRGYREWTPGAKAKVRKSSMRHFQLNDEAWLKEQYLSMEKTTTQIAKEVGCVVSTVFVALRRYDIPARSKSEARKGINFSNEHLKNITKANRAKALSSENHPNWQGGKTREWEKKIAAIKRHPKYKAWRKAVVSVGYCEACGSKNELQAHHIMPKSDFPHLIHDINNGKCLCRNCHATLHSKSGELLGSLEQTISSQAEEGILQKVQRLEDEARTVSNSSTSSARETDDIVRSSWGHEESLG